VKRLAPSITGLISAWGLSAPIALIPFFVFAMVAITMYSEASFKFVAPLACPNGTFSYRQLTGTYNRPGQFSGWNVECVSADGTRKDILLRVIGYLLALIYMACFVPMFIALGLIGFIKPPYLAGLENKDNPPSTIEPSFNLSHIRKE
jgi:hypothetical protein